jgi:hypothetical protein
LVKSQSGICKGKNLAARWHTSLPMVNGKTLKSHFTGEGKTDMPITLMPKRKVHWPEIQFSSENNCLFPACVKKWWSHTYARGHIFRCNEPFAASTWVTEVVIDAYKQPWKGLSRIIGLLCTANWFFLTITIWSVRTTTAYNGRASDWTEHRKSINTTPFLIMPDTGIGGETMQEIKSKYSMSDSLPLLRPLLLRWKWKSYP